MNGVTFGTKHSYSSWGLILSKKEISYPEPQTESVSVPGRDGDGRRRGTIQKPHPEIYIHCPGCQMGMEETVGNCELFAWPET